MTMTDGSSWNQILTDEDKVKALSVVLGIASALEKIAISDVSLSRGQAGIGIFFHYLDRMLPDQGYDEICIEHLNTSISQMAVQKMGPSFFAGITGIGWAVEHVLRRRFEEINECEDGYIENVNEELDQALEKSLFIDSWPGHFDLVSGLVGFGAYFLERFPNQKAFICLEMIVNHLENMAESDGRNIIWETPRLFSKHKQAEINLGMAHGLPCILAFLARTSQLGVARDQSHHMQSKAIEWFLRQKRQEAETQSDDLFPHLLLEGQDPGRSRLAWCYGDLGIALSLFSVGQSIERPDLVQYSIALASRCAQRSMDKTGVVSSGLCHGAAGLVHIFNRFYQATAQDIFREAALKWYRKLEQFIMIFQSDIYSSAKKFKVFVKNTREDQLGLLTGITGVGLTILTACSNQEPDWDAFLLADLSAIRV